MSKGLIQTTRTLGSIIKVGIIIEITTIVGLGKI